MIFTKTIFHSFYVKLVQKKISLQEDTKSWFGKEVILFMVVWLSLSVF